MLKTILFFLKTVLLLIYSCVIPQAYPDLFPTVVGVTVTTCISSPTLAPCMGRGRVLWSDPSFEDTYYSGFERLRLRIFEKSGNFIYNLFILDLIRKICIFTLACFVYVSS